MGRHDDDDGRLGDHDTPNGSSVGENGSLLAAEALIIIIR